MCGKLLCDSGSHRLEKEKTQYGEEYKQLDENNCPQLPSPRHLAEAFDVEHHYAAEDLHVLSVVILGSAAAGYAWLFR